MKHLLLILITFFCIKGFSQINCGNAPTLTEKGDSVNGERNGLWFEFTDGHLSSSGNYVNSQKDSTWTHYFFNNEKDGDFSIKNQKKLKISNIINFKKGVLNGISISYYDNGKKRYETIFKNDSLINKTNYYINGELEQIVKYDSTNTKGLPYVLEFIRYKSSKGYITYENFFDPNVGKPCYDHKKKKMVNKIIDRYDLETADGSYKMWITKTEECYEQYIIENGRKRWIFRN